MSFRLLSVIGLLAFFISACQAGSIVTDQPSRPTVTSTQSPVPTQIPTETLAATPTTVTTPTRTATQEVTPSPTAGEKESTTDAKIVEIQADDGLSLVGTFYEPDDENSPVPGVILLHMLWGDRSAWENFANQLSDAGYAVLAMDFRGHGETGGEVDWDKAVQDVEKILVYLKEMESVDKQRMVIIGASIGANVALTAAAFEPDVSTVVLLSPGGNYAGIKTRDPMLAYGERPVLIAASDEDTYAAESSVRLEELAAGEAELIMYEGSGHGTVMLDREPDLPELIIAWLDDHLQ